MTIDVADEYRIEELFVSDIKVNKRLRTINQAELDQICKSIAQIGLQTPITVRETEEGDIILVYGLHRLESVKQLGWQKIPCRIVDIDEMTARLWEIAENLHRAELSVLERTEQIAEWIRLTTEKQQEVSSQIETKLPQIGVGQGVGGGRRESGVNAAGRELGIDRNEAHRAINRTKNIPPPIRDRIRNLPSISNKGVELDALARAKPEQQEAAVTAVETGAAKSVREVLAPSPVIEDEDDDVSMSDTKPSVHAMCVQLEPLCRGWNDRALSIAITKVLQAAWIAPDAPEAGSNDPALDAKETIEELMAWISKLRNGRSEEC